MEVSDFFIGSVLKLLKNIEKETKFEEIICLGLGHFSDCVISRHQLSFILNLRDYFNIRNLKFRNNKEVTLKFFDPVFLKKEKEILRTFKCEVLDKNLEGKYLCEKPTIFYFPHCPKQLSNNLIWRNFLPEHLKNIVLISNSFQNIIDTTPERLLRPNAHYLLEINPYVTEHPLVNNFKFTDIFNDFSIHQFPEDVLETIPGEFWEKNSEPLYCEEDREFVKDDTASN